VSTIVAAEGCGCVVEQQEGCVARPPQAPSARRGTSRARGRRGDRPSPSGSYGVRDGRRSRHSRSASASAAARSRLGSSWCPDDLLVRGLGKGERREHAQGPAQGRVKSESVDARIGLDKCAGQVRMRPSACDRASGRPPCPDRVLLAVMSHARPSPTAARPARSRKEAAAGKDAAAGRRAIGSDRPRVDLVLAALVRRTAPWQSAPRSRSRRRRCVTKGSRGGHELAVGLAKETRAGARHGLRPGKRRAPESGAHETQMNDRGTSKTCAKRFAALRPSSGVLGGLLGDVG